MSPLQRIGRWRTSMAGFTVSDQVVRGCIASVTGEREVSREGHPPLPRDTLGSWVQE